MKVFEGKLHVSVTVFNDFTPVLFPFGDGARVFFGCILISDFQRFYFDFCFFSFCFCYRQDGVSDLIVDVFSIHLQGVVWVCVLVSCFHYGK